MGCHAFDKIDMADYADIINPLLNEIPGLVKALKGRYLPWPYEAIQ